MKSENVWGIIGFILCLLMVIVLILMIGNLIINKMHGIPEEYCSSSGGKWVFYECHDIPMGDVSCSDLKTGYWCEYPDGRKSLNESEIWYIFNSTEIAV